MGTNPINEAVVVVFGNSYAALVISLLLLVACGFIIAYNGRKYHYPIKRALSARIHVLQGVRAAPTVEASQREFAERFDEIDAGMMAPAGPQSEEFTIAWSQFRETILDETEVPMRATMRADGYFLHLGDDTRVLAWWANLFVAFGLTFTFLGIVAALTSTVTNLKSAGGTASMTPALIQLLTITSVKFWTSIAGVVASIILRYFDRRWHAHTQRQLECIVDALDRGTLFSPAQRIAAEQLRETKEQTGALKTFSHELAIAIGDNLERQIQPMVQVLGGIQSSIDEFKSGSFNQIGKELSEAISRNAGAEMQQLGAVLTDMTTRLSAMHEHIESSGRAANEQIAAAARDFAASSDRMSEMFSALHERIDATGTRLTESADTASRVAAEQFLQATSGFQSAFDQVRGEISDLGSKLSEGAQTAADRNAEVLSRAANVLETATLRASDTMSESIDAAITRAGEESAKAMSQAFAAFGTRFDEASGALTETLRTTAGRMEALAASIERSTSASDTHATKMAQAGARAEDVATVLGKAANDLEDAAAPIRSATGGIERAVAQVQSALERQVESTSQSQVAISQIADGLTQTSEAAAQAWRDYRVRFEDVDRALAQSLDQIKGASVEHAGSLNEQVGRIDNALAGAIDKLSAGLDPLTELAEQIEDLVGRLRATA